MSRTYVLVPGAWHGGWAWHPVARELESAGHRVIALTLPGLSAGEDPAAVSLADATECVAAEIERRDLRDVVLVCQDSSAYPVTAAAHRVRRRLARLVYWSGFVPVPGESVLDTIPAADADMLTAAAEAAGGDSVLVPPHRWRANFLNTAPEHVQDLTYSLLRPQPMAYFTESLDAAEAEVPDLPVSYIVGSADQSLPRDDNWYDPKYTARLGVRPLVIDACHAAFFTTPRLLADALDTVSSGH
ncbi:MAG TPA: alpha/beta fold hydrolase [Pseudonocardia sp.]|nr:alpha/beta fold hydrolase [Pseudonocardia sp.]